jgi:signal transduction histidine kinase
MSPNDPMVREAVQSIAGSAQLQARLIDDILDVSRIVSGKLRLTPEAVEVSRLIMNAIDAVTPTAEAKQIVIRASIDPDLGTLVIDATRIQQIVWNLLSNAVKFTPRHGLVEISAQRMASEVQITVRDTGEGIDPAFLPHVFEPFRQAENPQTRTHGGLGLGLSIVRYIAEAHGGSVTAESEGRGRGATFIVTLPIRPIATADGTVRKNVGATFLQRDRLRGVDIVLVGDDAQSRTMVTTVLRAAGANVVPLDSAIASLDVFERRQLTLAG